MIIDTKRKMLDKTGLEIIKVILGQEGIITKNELMVKVKAEVTMLRVNLITKEKLVILKNKQVLVVFQVEIRIHRAVGDSTILIIRKIRITVIRET